MKEEHIKGYKFFRGVLRGIYKFWYNPTIIGAKNIPKSGPIIVCGNHLHIMDQCAIIISTKRMIHYMAKKEYFDSKFAWFFKMNGCISVNRSTKDERAKEHALEILNNGYAIGIFPEGTRNRTKEILLPFKFGAVSLASKTNAYLVPFGITGNYKFRSKNLIIRIGKPFKVGKMTYEEANNMLRDRISSLMKENIKEKYNVV